MLFAAILGSTAAAGTKVIKNDTFTGVGSVFTGVSFGEYQGAGVLFEPSLADYPLKIIAIDVLLAPYAGNAVLGQYEFDLWDESAGTVPPPTPNDGGSYYYGRISREARALTPSSTMFNRFTFTNPVIVPSGKVFVKVSQILDTNSDGTTIALDNATTPKPNANWYFDGFGSFHRFDQADGGYFNGLNRNWIIRLVLEVPDVSVTVTSITPSSSLASTASNVVITGSNFELGARAYLGTNELSLSNLTAQSIAASVPIGLPAGTYDVRVRNLSGVEGVLPNGYRIFDSDGGMGSGGGGGGSGGGGGGTGGGTGGGSGAGGGGSSTGSEALSLTAITPAQTYAGDATSLFLTGAGFGAGAKVLIGGTRVEGAEVESAGLISASLAADALTPGTYDVSVLNLSGDQATLPQAFKVLAGTKAKPGCSCTQLDFFPVLLAALAFIRRRRP